MNPTKKIIKQLLPINLIVSFLCVSIFAFGNAGFTSLFSMMEGKKFDQVIISTDFDQFLANKTKGEYQAARILLRNSNGELEKLDIDIIARGKYRLMNCTAMPPIKISVAKETQQNYGFTKNYRKFKLVTHCIEDNDQAVLKEYWAYKMFNQLTPNSFRVHLMEVIYHNTADNSKETHMAFLIEDTDELADRLGGEEKKVWGLEANEVDASAYQDFVLFQHLIGNPDWDITSVRNVKFIYRADQDKPIIVPYDFDYAALVDAAYIPNFGKLGSLKDQIKANAAQENKQTLNPICQKIEKVREQDWDFELCQRLSSQSKRDMKLYLQSSVTKIKRVKKSLDI